VLCAAVALVAAGCGSNHAARTPPPLATGPAGVLRVALTDFRWPLDPVLARGRDETTLARALYSTPLRTDPATGTVVPGLCTAWKASRDFRRWTFTCNHSAPSIAAGLRRLVQLRDAPAHWLFAQTEHITANATTLNIRLRFSWRRFPYALTAVGAAPRLVEGPFKLVSGTKRLVVARREGLTLEFHRLGARAAVRGFRQGKLDEAPVPLGDIVATKADVQLGSAVRARTLLGLDVVELGPIGYRLQRAYRDTAVRGDYGVLISELSGSSAYGFLGGEKPDPARFRRALGTIPSLPRRLIRISVPPVPALRAGARLLYSQWRDVGLGPQLSTTPMLPVQATFQRVLAVYPQEEAIPAELVLRNELKPRDSLLRALGATQQRHDLELVDEGLWASARAIPIAWVVDARLVSPRLEGWREDVLGNVDYAAVRSLASSRRP
jgi:hypothetical protein